MLPYVDPAPAKRKALYALSADPITFGHMNIVERVARLFDEVIFGIGNNPTKNYLFSLEERLALAKASLARFPNVTVVAFRGMLTDFALEEKADVVVKGVRNTADFDYELLLHQVGVSQQAGIDTHVLFAEPQLSHVSSTVVKAIQLEHGSIQGYVPLPVKAAMEKRISQQTLVGVTGAIAAGKSTLCRQLVELGTREDIEVHHIDTDILAHAILEAGDNKLFASIKHEIVNLLGTDILDGNAVDRHKVGQRIFGDPQRRTEFNRLMLGPLRLQVRKQLAGKRGIILLESALLTEANLLPLCNNRIILVNVPDRVRSQRLKARGHGESDIQARNLAQFSPAQKSAAVHTQIERDSFGFCWEISGEATTRSSLYSLLMDIHELGLAER